MKSLMFVGITVCCVSYAQSSAQTENCKECRHVLQGLFDSQHVFSSQQSQQQFTKFLCTTDFGTHDDAMNFGLSIGTLVYGVPLKIGGQFSKQEKDSWKKTHCESTASSSSSSISFVMFLRTVRPEIAKDWLECVKAVCAPQREGVSCSELVSSGQLGFVAQWKRGVGDNQAPKVLRLTTVNATCVQPPRQGDLISEAGRVLTCKIGTEKDTPLVALETTKGTCLTQGSGLFGNRTLAGRIELMKATHFQAGQLVISDGTKIVTNGHRLVLEADEIRLEGSPQVIAFEGGATGAAAGEVIVKGRVLSGTTLAINNKGQKGAKGSAGSQGAKGAKGGGGSQRDFFCGGGRNGDQGGVGGKGGNGGTGGTGGSGGTVTVDVISGLKNGAIDRLAINVNGGDGGDGGDPGPPGPGGDGGDGAPGTANCNGTQPGPPGPQGSPGGPGSTGATGRAGTVVYIR